MARCGIPLKRKWNTISPFVGPVNQSSQNASSNKLTHDEALPTSAIVRVSYQRANTYHVGVRRHVDPEGQWKDLRSIGWGGTSEDSPRKTTEDLTDEENLDIRSEEHDEERAGEGDESADNSPLLPEFIDDDTIKEHTYLTYGN